MELVSNYCCEMHGIFPHISLLCSQVDINFVPAEEHNTELKPLSAPVEIPPISNDANIKSEDQEFASSDILELLEEKNLDVNLLTTADHGSKEEMLIGRGLLNSFFALLIQSNPAIF